MGEAQQKETAERSEDVGQYCVFPSSFGTFLLPYLAKKEEEKYKW